MVAEAASGKSKHDQLQAEQRAAARARRDLERHGPKDSVKENPAATSEPAAEHH